MLRDLIGTPIRNTVTYFGVVSATRVLPELCKQAARSRRVKVYLKGVSLVPLLEIPSADPRQLFRARSRATSGQKVA